LLSVLVVDRERDIRGLFETVLKTMGHRVKAQEFLDEHESGGEVYDLILLDMGSFDQKQKPVLDAYTSKKLCVSSIWSESRLPSNIKVDYDYYLQKPFKIDSLRKILDSVKCLSP